MENEHVERLNELAKSFDSTFEGAGPEDVKEFIQSFDRLLTDVEHMIY